jgi:heme-degrading monooxygenase HmoA
LIPEHTQLLGTGQEGSSVIARLWRGVTASVDADAYLEYLHQTGLSEYRAAAGNLAVFALRRINEGRTEFWLISFWDSIDAIRGFAGADMSRAVFYPEDDRFLLERGEQVEHFDVVFSAGGPSWMPRM